MSILTPCHIPRQMNANKRWPNFPCCELNLICFFHSGMDLCLIIQFDFSCVGDKTWTMIEGTKWIYPQSICQCEYKPCLHQVINIIQLSPPSPLYHISKIHKKIATKSHDILIHSTWLRRACRIVIIPNFCYVWFTRIRIIIQNQC